MRNLDENAVDRLHRIVDEALLAGGGDCVHNFFLGVYSQANTEGVPFDAAVLLEYWSDLVRTGIVAVPGDQISATPFVIRRLLLTTRGRHLLENRDASPHNPSKYLAAARRRVSNPDDIALSYLGEAVEAWRCGLYRSSAVMLGCACERLVLLLAEAISGNRALPGFEKLAKSLSGRVFISALFEEIRVTLTRLKSDRKLPTELGDAIDRKLSAVFDHARGLRNDSGHPTGEAISADDAEAGLLLFPGFYSLVDHLISHLQLAGTDSDIQR